MTKRWSFIFCSSLNVMANLLMIWPFNSGEGIFSNLFLIIITLILLVVLVNFKISQIISQYDLFDSQL
ncbi:hypothetical protein ACFOSE_07670, partial [Streptococcus dentapri]